MQKIAATRIEVNVVRHEADMCVFRAIWSSSLQSRAWIASKRSLLNLEERGFGVSLWRSLSKLETWAESHHTHLSIFVTFTRLAKKFKELTLYHEVSVFDASNQYFEYINCQPKTGILRGVMPDAGPAAEAASGMEAVGA